MAAPEPHDPRRCVEHASFGIEPEERRPRLRTNRAHRAVTDQHLGYRTLKVMALNSILYSFADDSLKTRLRSGLDSAFARFERQR